MQAKKVAKYNISSMKKSIIIFYSIFISICILLVILSRNVEGSSSSGLELSSAIFIFIAGLNIFKENFYFAKSNNISRKSYFLGTILSMLPIAGFMSIIDIIINRIYNLFIESPTIYDMGFTNFNQINYIYIANWIQQNDIKTLFETFLFQTSLYLMLFVLGFVITMIYYKCNKFMKTVTSVAPIMLIILFNMYMNNNPRIAFKVSEFVQYILGVNPINVYAPITTFIILFIILGAIAYSLIRKMVIKER